MKNIRILLILMSLMFAGLLSEIGTVNAAPPAPNIDSFTIDSNTGLAAMDVSTFTHFTNELALIEIYAGNNPTATTPVISNNQGLTFTQRIFLRSGSQQLYEYWAIVPTAAFISVTITIPGSPNPCNALPQCAAWGLYITNENALNPFDTTPPSTNQVAFSSSGGTQSGFVDFTNRFDYDLVIGICNALSYCTAGPGFTELSPSGTTQECGNHGNVPPTKCLNIETRSTTNPQYNHILFVDNGATEVMLLGGEGIVGTNAVIPSGGSGGTTCDVSIPSTGKYLFYDDFQGPSGTPTKWSIQLSPTVTTKLITTSGGRAIIVSRVQGDRQEMIANNTDPIISTNMPGCMFIYDVWKLSIDNMTSDTLVTDRQTGLPTSRIFTSLFGLTDNSRLNFIGFRILHSENPNAWGETQNVKVEIEIVTRSPNCIGSTVCTAGTTVPVAITNQYMSLSNGEHYLTMQMKLSQFSLNSWIDFEIDGDAHYNVTDAACTCIKPIDSLNPYYPYASTQMCETSGGIFGMRGNFVCGIQFVTSPSRSVATSIAYNIIADYKPQTLPSGTPVFWDQPGGLKGPLESTTPDITNALQGVAFGLTPGYPAFGGVLVSLLFVAVALGFTIGSGIRFPFIYTIEILGILLVCLSLNILPLWIGLSAIIIQLGGSLGLYALTIRRENV